MMAQENTAGPTVAEIYVAAALATAGITSGDEIESAYADCNFLTDDILCALAREGADLEHLHRRWLSGAVDIPRIGRVVPAGIGAFEFAEEDTPGSRPAMIMLVRDENGDPEDLCAWAGNGRPPRRWLGRGVLLGAESVFGPRLKPELVVHENLMAWFRATCTGVVVLDPVLAAPLLRRCEPLEAASPAHARELRRMLEQRQPRVTVASRADRELAVAA
jgi:hypothetical protein